MATSILVFDTKTFLHIPEISNRKRSDEFLGIILWHTIFIIVTPQAKLKVGNSAPRVKSFSPHNEYSKRTAYPGNNCLFN